MSPRRYARTGSTLLLAGLFAFAPAATALADQPDPGILGLLAPAPADPAGDETPVEPAAPAEPAPAPVVPKPGTGKPVLAVGDEGHAVKVLQVRLERAGVRDDTPVTGVFGKETTASVKAFQKKMHFAKTGVLDRGTLDALEQATGTVDKADIAAGLNRPYGKRLPASCLHEHVICVDKTLRNVRWVVDGTVRFKLDARFGSDELPTREGIYAITRKSRDHISSLYHTSMPFALFFDRGQAVHYSSDFAARGYNGASHGCVNVRDYKGMQRLFNKAQTGDRVVVYRSRPPLEAKKDAKKH
jgi:peptidoglycan hydrolase-like protein with peptidoglycan-binding domain